MQASRPCCLIRFRSLSGPEPKPAADSRSLLASRDPVPRVGGVEIRETPCDGMVPGMSSNVVAGVDRPSADGVPGRDPFAVNVEEDGSR